MSPAHWSSRPKTDFSAPPGAAETLIDRREAARILGISDTTWQVWTREGRVPRATWRPSGRGPYAKLFTLADVLRMRDEIEARYQPYPDPQRPGVYRLPLRSKVPMEAIIDAESVPLVQGKFWIWEYADRYKTGSVMLSATVGSNTQLKRIILGIDDNRLAICHVNGDPLDCRRANLIMQTPSEKLFRSRKKGAVSGREYTSKYKGVSWDESRGKWKAQIQHNKRNRGLGRFDSEIEAAEAYDRAAREAFGEYALLNFGETVPPGCRQAAA